MIKEPRKQNNIPTFVIVFYRIVLPTVTILLLLGLSQILPRSKIGSEVIDVAIRIFLCIFFCYGYINMPYISKRFWYFTFPKIKKSQVVIFPESKIRSLGMICLRFIIIAILTKLIIDEFLPIFSSLSIALALLNGVIFALPALAQYIALNKLR